MANNLNLGVAAGNVEASAIVALCNSGTLKLYTGTQPATPDTAIGSVTLLATLTFASTAISGSPSSGVATYAAIGSGTAVASGTPTWFRIWESNGTTAVMDGTVGLVSGYDAIIDAVPIVSGATVSCSTGTYTSNLG
jgi:hypothetical protein